jgi:hypothetical protein
VTKRGNGKVLILGCGPAGLFAAHALARRGVEFDIWSKYRRSEMFGAQYLHMNLPGLTEEADRAWVSYRLIGTNEEYARKVYGDEVPDFVSPERYVGIKAAWDIRAAYYRAWREYSSQIWDCDRINADWWVRHQDMWEGYRFIVSTIPRTELCAASLTGQQHTFRMQEIWAIGDAPERGIRCPIRVAPAAVVCDGTRDVSWYRAANVFDYCTVEWSTEFKPPIEHVAKVVKPIGTNCNCWIDRITFLGRYGAWDKGQLSHDAYTRVHQLVARHRSFGRVRRH